MQSRYYDPAIKRFINADDVSLLGANGDFASFNLYAYCGNNPVARADEGGEFWNIVTGTISGALTSSVLPVEVITFINSATSFVASIGVDMYSGEQIDVNKAYRAAYWAAISSMVGGHGIRHAKGDYSVAVEASKKAASSAKEAARGIARKAANKVANIARYNVSKVYFRESIKQVGIAMITMPTSALMGSVWPFN